MNLQLKDRVALVTGSSRGIGRATALGLAREGARVAVTYHTQREKADAVVGEIEAARGEALAVQLDLASLDSIQTAARQVLDRWGHIDVLVNNAQQWPDRLPWQAPPFEELSPDEWRPLLRMGTEGPYAAIQAVLPSMRERGWGRLVNISSGVAVDGVPGTGAYAAAKASLHGLTRTLAKELGPAGVLVNVVMPGVTLTERMSQALPAAVREPREKESPIGRLLQPEDVAATIVFLCSPTNTSVTGEIIRASGGIA